SERAHRMRVVSRRGRRAVRQDARVEDVTNLAAQFAWQAAACRELGAPFTAQLLEHAAADFTARGVTYDALADHLDAPQGAATPLRLVGALHRLVLAERAPGLAQYYPRAGFAGDATGAWGAAIPVIRADLAS